MCSLFKYDRKKRISASRPLAPILSAQEGFLMLAKKSVFVSV